MTFVFVDLAVSRHCKGYPRQGFQREHILEVGKHCTWESADEDASTILRMKRKSLIERLKASEEPAFFPEQMLGSDAVTMAKLIKNRPQKVIHFLTSLFESFFLRKMGNVFSPFPALVSSSLTTLVATPVLSDCCARCCGDCAYSCHVI